MGRGDIKEAMGLRAMVAVILLGAMILPLVTRRPGEKGEGPFYRRLLGGPG